MTRVEQHLLLDYAWLAFEKLGIKRSDAEDEYLGELQEKLWKEMSGAECEELEERWLKMQAEFTAQHGEPTEIASGLSRATMVGLLRESPPATVIWRCIDGNGRTAAQMIVEIETGTELGRQWASDVLRVSRDLLGRRARRDARDEKRERVLCAAIWVDDGQEHPHQPHNIPAGMVFSGWRHHNCFTALNAVYPRPTGKADEEQLAGRHQGFLTSRGRYVGRKEAAIIARAAGQLERKDIESLTSEDLY